MRFLFTCLPGLGHFHPMVPLARALQQAGHAVAFATAPAFAETVADAGLAFIPAGMDWDERRLLETVPELRRVSQIYRGEWMMSEIFLDRSPRRMIPDLMTIITDWRPDMIVAGSFEYGGPIAAEKAGLRYANGNYTIRWNRWIMKLAIGRAMKKLRRESGLAADPQLHAFGRYLDLCFAPPSWTFEEALLRPGLTRLVRTKLCGRDLPLQQRVWGLTALMVQRLFARALKRDPTLTAIGTTTHFIGEDCPEEGGGEAGAGAIALRPDWLEAMPRRPTIFVSLGTVLSAEYPDVVETILAALSDQPVNLVLTLGGSADPARFGPQPPHIRLVRFMTQAELAELLPHVDLCINHAGYNSVMDALRRGVPLLLLPLVTDAPLNTQMCLLNGVAPELPPEVLGLSPRGLPVIRPERLTPAIVRETVMRTLQDPRYREAARRMQEELAGRSGVDVAVGLLEQVAGEQGADPRVS